MADTFNNPIQDLQNQDLYSPTETGISNVNTPAFIKMNDNGDIEIIAQDGLGIILSAASNTVTIMGHGIRFLTTDTNGLVWNRTAFNDQATTYTEAPLITLTDTDLSQMFAGVEDYLPGSSS